MIIKSRHDKERNREMDLYELVHALNWTYGVRLALNKEKTRVGLLREDAARVPSEVKRAIRKHHDEVLRSALFRDAHERLQRWMIEKYGADPDGPLVRDAYGALGKEETHERLNEAWYGENLDAFKEALVAYMRPGAEAFKRALAEEESEQDPLTARITQSPSSSRGSRDARRSPASGRSRGGRTQVA
jgi:hypothetical protein